MKIYLDGTYKTIDSKTFQLLLPGSLQGHGAFETMRMYKGVVFAFKSHMIRLRRGLKHYKSKLPLSERKIQNILKRLIQKTKLKNARVRVIVWKDTAQHVSISLERLRSPSFKKYCRGYKITVSKLRKARTRHSHIKTIDYKKFQTLYQEIVRCGYDEALMLNSKNHIVEGTRTNVFFIKKGNVYTPAIDCGCLNGITRQKVMKCARTLGMTVFTVHAQLRELMNADEVFVTGSTLEIMPVFSINHKRIGNGQGIFTQRLRTSYKQLVQSAIKNDK